MTHVTATDTFHQMKRDEEEKGTTHHQDEQIEVRPEAATSEETKLHDLEKNGRSHEAAYDLVSHVQTDDGESYVTAKTWAVVVVRYYPSSSSSSSSITAFCIPS